MTPQRWLDGNFGTYRPLCYFCVFVHPKISPTHLEAPDNHIKLQNVTARWQNLLDIPIQARWTCRLPLS